MKFYRSRESGAGYGGVCFWQRGYKAIPGKNVPDLRERLVNNHSYQDQPVREMKMLGEPSQQARK